MTNTIAHTTGEVIEVRCNLDDCPAPIVGVYLPEYYEPAAVDSASEHHLWVHHLLPARLQEVNAQLSTLEAFIPGISTVMAECGLKFEWEAA